MDLSKSEYRSTKVVAELVARKEVEAWLDFKRVPDSQRAKQEKEIDALVDAICEGNLEFSKEEDGVVTQKLIFPIETTNGQITVLRYKKRIQYNEVKRGMQNVSPNDIDGRILAYIGLLTGELVGLAGKMDTTDMQIARAYIIFFL